MKDIDRMLLGLGVLIPFWLFFGVLLTALAYPGYSHLDQAMSQLGAQGSPTQGFSAWVNNLPLGLFFVLFAVGVMRQVRGSRLASFSAVLILVHGLASFATGYFACDQGCAPAQPSFSQQMHNLAGLVMFLSLTLASLLWSFLSKRLLGSRGFGLFSLACTVLAVATVVLMAQAVESGHGFGLYQRINYGISVIWVAGLALMAARDRAGSLRCDTA
ncbi:cbs domain-containing protein [Ectopseudomonas mendocina]|uniref:DUF998 domain-containing protein n=1 Tax=Ectopseudomonas mendocina TaxID=300 RepID=UPI000E059422|nr:DUF998 domain-containing protein [Pseudomonas mendocina]SUD35857.1 cbs domain-containing protein [Pseudomonas mendocina]